MFQQSCVHIQDNRGTCTSCKMYCVLQAELNGVLPVKHGCFQPLQHSAIQWSHTLKQAAAVCHSLSMVNKSTVAGADLERSMFKMVEGAFLVSLNDIYAGMSNQCFIKVTATFRTVKSVSACLLATAVLQSAQRTAGASQSSRCFATLWRLVTGHMHS